MTSKGKSSKQKTKAQDSASRSAPTVTEDSEPSQENALEQFERELYWCIDQLQLGLETQNPDSKRAQEATKILKILTSTKAPMIKKRQAMRNTFGDYRQKMKEEERKSSALAKKIKLSSVDQSGMQKSQFFKKSTSKIAQKSSDINNDINESFKFGFTISDDMEQNCDIKPVIDEMGDQGHSEELGAGSSTTQFSFVKSENDFKFNFAMPNDT